MQIVQRIFHTTIPAGWVLLAPLISSLLTAGAVIMYASIYPVIGMHPDTMLDPLSVVIGLVYPLLGAYILRRSPGNAIAWLFCLMGLVAAFYVFSLEYGVLSYLVLAAPLPLADVATWVQSWAWYVPLNLLVLVVHLYPTGRVLSPRWRIVFWAVAAAIPVLILVTLVFLWPYRGPLLFAPQDQIPTSAARSQEMMRLFWLPVVGIPLFIGMPAGVIALIIRLRRAGAVERQQIKWFLYAGALFAAGLLATLAVMLNGEGSLAGTLMWTVLLPLLAALLPVVVAFAIRRYRLFEIDLIIRRTLAYSILTTILVVIYLGGVLFFQALLRAVTGSESTLAVVASTLVIAALFSPLRQRIQNAIDRRFFRSRYSTETLVADLSTALQTEMDLDRMAQSVIETVDGAVQPESLSLWLLRKRAENEPADHG